MRIKNGKNMGKDQKIYHSQTSAILLARPLAASLNNDMEHSSLAIPANDTAPVSNKEHTALLLAVGQQRDKAAFSGLFAYYAPRIKSFLMKGGAAPDLADELAQETMVTVWQKATSFDPAKASASTWIFTIARNKRIDGLRKKIRPETDIDDPAFEVADDTPLVSDELSNRQESETVSSALKTLPREQADLLYKSFFEDKTHADIAKETNIPLGTVKSRIRLALEKLRGDERIGQLWS